MALYPLHDVIFPSFTRRMAIMSGALAVSFVALMDFLYFLSIIYDIYNIIYIYTICALFFFSFSLSLSIIILIYIYIYLYDNIYIISHDKRLLTSKGPLKWRRVIDRRSFRGVSILQAVQDLSKIWAQVLVLDCGWCLWRLCMNLGVFWFKSMLSGFLA